jgi:hypothetical protein
MGSHFNCKFFFLILEEPYQQMLAKALAHYFEAKLLLLDATDFSLKASLYCCSLLVLFFLPLFLSFIYFVCTNI